MAEKNTRGDLGPICDYCAGYGYTNSLSREGGSSAGCPRCFGSGLQPIDVRKLANQVEELTKIIKQNQKENKYESTILG